MKRREEVLLQLQRLLLRLLLLTTTATTSTTITATTISSTTTSTSIITPTTIIVNQRRLQDLGEEFWRCFRRCPQASAYTEHFNMSSDTLAFRSETACICYFQIPWADLWFV